jgi:hypothetical protein
MNSQGLFKLIDVVFSIERELAEGIDLSVI